MKKIFLLTIAAVVMTVCACGQENDPGEKLNTYNGSVTYETEKAESELSVAEDVSFEDGFHAQVSEDIRENGEEDPDLYVATYEYGGNTYTGGYAKDCDFKSYLNLPTLAGAEAAKINERDYNIAYYADNVKAGYYYEDDGTCVYVYTDAPMGDVEFKEAIEAMDLKK